MSNTNAAHHKNTGKPNAAAHTKAGDEAANQQGKATAAGTTNTPASDATQDSHIISKVESTIEPEVPQPPAPSENFDPAHGSGMDTYPSEAAAANAPGLHVDLTQTQKPVGVIPVDNHPPFHRVDGEVTGTRKGMDEAVADASVGRRGPKGNPTDAHGVVANLHEHVAAGEMKPHDAHKSLVEQYKAADKQGRKDLRHAVKEHGKVAERMSQVTEDFDKADAQDKE